MIQEPFLKYINLASITADIKSLWSLKVVSFSHNERCANEVADELAKLGTKRGQLLVDIAE